MYLLGVDSFGVVQLRITLMDGGFIGRTPNNIVASDGFSRLRAIRRVL